MADVNYIVQRKVEFKRRLKVSLNKDQDNDEMLMLWIGGPLFFVYSIYSLYIFSVLAAATWGIVISVILGPIAYIVLPIQEGFSNGNWWPAIVLYFGWPIVASVGGIIYAMVIPLRSALRAAKTS